MDRLFESVNLSEIRSDLTGGCFPFYQPIFSMEEKKVIGYEVLARAKNSAGEVVSLGSIFSDSGISEDFKKKLDLYIREEAVIKYAAKKLSGKSKLFINISPQRLIKDISIENIEDCDAIKESATLKILERHNIDPGSIILELTGSELGENQNLLEKIIICYKEKGFLIAVDNMGIDPAQLRFAENIKPHYIKLNIGHIRKNTSPDRFFESLRSISSLSKQTGSVLLIEGVEMEKEIYGSLDIGAGLLQGFLFARPEENFLEGDFLTNVIQKYSDNYKKKKIDHLKMEQDLKDSVTSKLKELCDSGKIQFNGDAENKKLKIEMLPKSWSDFLLGIYAVDRSGIQITPEYRLESKENPRLIQFAEYNNKDISNRKSYLSFMASEDKSNFNWTFQEGIHEATGKKPYFTLMYKYSENIFLSMDLHFTMDKNY